MGFGGSDLTDSISESNFSFIPLLGYERVHVAERPKDRGDIMIAEENGSAYGRYLFLVIGSVDRSGRFRCFFRFPGMASALRFRGWGRLLEMSKCRVSRKKGHFSDYFSNPGSAFLRKIDPELIRF
ncbi:hypothetical protein AVEN_35405-1 [Araneus ventricosus]|uniref:Uncharacterized protein n=1 Tax=Araneus ventricosus TaxID=182803 RepID=A0A4Y2N9R4_ARAVE|nr:hypothetical protein AVEN_35405-1 [Araneus ventricosus]